MNSNQLYNTINQSSYSNDCVRYSHLNRILQPITDIVIGVLNIIAAGLSNTIAMEPSLTTTNAATSLDSTTVSVTTTTTCTATTTTATATTAPATTGITTPVTTTPATTTPATPTPATPNSATSTLATATPATATPATATPATATTIIIYLLHSDISTIAIICTPVHQQIVF